MKWVINENNPKVAVEETGGGEVQVDIKSGECQQHVRATLPPSMLFADRALLRRGYSISEPNAWGETVSKPLGLTLGLVYNPSRLQLTRQSLHSIAKWEWHGWICWPWWALQVIKRQVGCRSAVWVWCSWVGREWGGGAEGSHCRADLFLGPLVCKAVGERRVQQYVEWRFGFMPIRTSTGYRLLAIRCRWRFLATRWSGYPYLSHTCGVLDYDVVIDVWP